MIPSEADVKKAKITKGELLAHRSGVSNDIWRLLADEIDQALAEARAERDGEIAAHKGPEVTALVKYAKHNGSCDVVQYSSTCNCGLSQVLAQYHEAVKP